MSPQTNPDYQEIRQIVLDAIEPIKEQLKDIAASLRNDYARKDVVEPRIEAIEEQMRELKQAQVTSPQKFLMYAGSLAALIWTLIEILTHLK